jgi:hypothetical protein
MKPPDKQTNKAIALVHLLCHHIRKLVASLSGQTSHQKRLSGLSRRHAQKAPVEDQHVKQPRLYWHGLKLQDREREKNASAIFFDKRDKRTPKKF